MCSGPRRKERESERVRETLDGLVCTACGLALESVCNRLERRGRGTKGSGVLTHLGAA